MRYSIGIAAVPALLLAWASAYTACAEDQPEVAPATPAETKASVKKVDAQQVKALIEKLASESYDEREAATAALIKLGSGILPEIEKWDKNPADPELLARLSFVRVELGLEAVTTMEQAKAIYLKFMDESQKADPGSKSAEEFQAKAARAMKLVEKFASEKERFVVAANLYYESGMRYYQKYRQGAPDKIGLLQAAKELDAAVELYQKHLDKNPGDKAIENRQIEANMILYACHKYASF